MNTDNARILVIGAGTNGSVCASRLCANGASVTVLARGKRYEQVKTDGIIIENPLTKERTSLKVPVIDILKPDDVYEYILVVIRKSDITDLLPVLAKNKSPNIVFMSNNLSGPDEITAKIDKKRVLMGFVFGSGKLENGIVYAISELGGILRMIFKKNTPFGELDGSSTPRLERLIRIFRGCALPVTTSSNIVDYLSAHAAIVVLIAIYMVKHDDKIKTQKDLSEMMRSDEYLTVSISSLREFIDLFEDLGHKIIPTSMRLIKVTPLPLIKAMFKGLANSKLGEIIMYDYSNGREEIKYLAKELEVLVRKSRLPASSIRSLLEMD